MVATLESTDTLAATVVPDGASPSVAVLTGCKDRPYALGLAMALVAKGLPVDMIGSDEEDSPDLHVTPNLRFLNFRGHQNDADKFSAKLTKLLLYYARLYRYALRSKPKTYHILWNHKLEYIDRTLSMVYYKLLGKKIALTVHNVNQAKRDRQDTLMNRLTLKTQYRLCDHMFVHTKKMKDELLQDFGVADSSVTVIRHPINSIFPDTELTSSQAKSQLGLNAADKTVLFLGRIKPYKGIELLLAAFQILAKKDPTYRLVIAGEPHKGSEAYLDEIRKIVARDFGPDQVLLKFGFIPDDQMELYLKGGDVLVLPYKDIFQSGVLFLAYNFGLPVVATDVGSFREEIVDGETGFICKPEDAANMAQTLETYFASDLYKNLAARRQDIKDYANRVHSWDAAAELTTAAYRQMSVNHSL
jgi:D-inositol-3-phosphate glycosyltransferase